MDSYLLLLLINIVILIYGLYISDVFMRDDDGFQIQSKKQFVFICVIIAMFFVLIHFFIISYLYQPTPDMRFSNIVTDEKTIPFSMGMSCSGIFIAGEETNCTFSPKVLPYSKSSLKNFNITIGYTSTARGNTPENFTEIYNGSLERLSSIGKIEKIYVGNASESVISHYTFDFRFKIYDKNNGTLLYLFNKSFPYSPITPYLSTQGQISKKNNSVILAGVLISGYIVIFVFLLSRYKNPKNKSEIEYDR